MASCPYYRHLGNLMIDRIGGIAGHESVHIRAIECFHPGFDDLSGLTGFHGDVPLS